MVSHNRKPGNIFQLHIYTPERARIFFHLLFFSTNHGEFAFALMIKASWWQTGCSNSKDHTLTHDVQRNMGVISTFSLFCFLFFKQGIIFQQISSNNYLFRLVHLFPLLNQSLEGEEVTLTNQNQYDSP